MKKLFSFPVLCALLIAIALIFVIAVRSCSTPLAETPATTPQATISVS